MKTDRYTKTILTIIAICLSINVVKDIDFIPSTYATETTKASVIPDGFKLVPVEDAAVMDVRIVDINTYKELNVNLKKVSTYDPIKVNLQKIETRDKMEVNISEIGGRWVSNGGPIPVKIQ
ncbi:MAG: hypothetical protein WBA61_01745 [Aequorivita sp.]